MRCLTLLAAVAASVLCGSVTGGCRTLLPDNQAEAKAAAAERRASEEKDLFVYMSRHFVEKRLKSPGSVKFPAPSSATVTKLTDNKYRVASYFERKNDSGALMRSTYACEVTKITSAKWHCDAMQIKAPEMVK